MKLNVYSLNVFLLRYFINIILCLDLNFLFNRLIFFQYQGTIHGEELPYIFGAPLVGGFSHFGLNYTKEEQFLSELVMTLWTNFAKTG